MKNSSKKIVITGGLGFIFSHVTEYLVARGHNVVVIDNCSMGSHPEIANASFKLVREDFSAPGASKLVIDEKPDWIIHAAGITDVDYSIKHPEEVFRNNLMCNLNAFEAARLLPNLEKMLYINTDEVYGECEYRKKETDILFPRNPYSASKAAGALMRYAYDTTYEALREKTAEIRMCNIFGPRQDDRKIFPLMVKSIKQGTSIPLQNNGEGYREYLYVKNVPPIVEQVMQSGNRTYNITLNDGFTVVQLIAKIEALTGKKIAVHDAKRAGHDRFYRMDNSRIKQEFSWKPAYSFEEGLKEYLHHEKIT